MNTTPENPHARRNSILLLVAIVLAAGIVALLLVTSRSKSALSIQDDSSSEEGTQGAATLRGIGEKPKQETTGALDLVRDSVVVRAIDLFGRPIDPIVIEVVDSNEAVELTGEDGNVVQVARGSSGVSITVSAQGYRSQRVNFDAAAVREVEALLEELPNDRRVRGKVLLGDLSFAVAAQIRVSYPNGSVIESRTDSRGRYSMELGENQSDVPGSLVATYVDKTGMSYVGKASNIRPSAYGHIVLRAAERFQGKIHMTLDDEIPSPKEGLIKFLMFKKGTGVLLGGGGKSGKRTYRLSCAFSGTYELFAVDNGRVVGAATAELSAEKQTVHVVLRKHAGLPKIQVHLDQELYPDLSHVFVIDAGVEAAISAGTLNTLKILALSGGAWDRHLWVRHSVIRVPVPQDVLSIETKYPSTSRSCWLYAMSSRDEVLGRVLVSAPTAREVVRKVSLDRNDPDSMGRLTLEFGGDFESLRNAFLTLWDGRVVCYRGAADFIGSQLTLPSLPPGEYELGIGRQKDAGQYDFSLPVIKVRVPPPGVSKVMYWSPSLFR